jgi:long-chain acyl-CoA synthetase
MEKPISIPGQQRLMAAKMGDQPLIRYVDHHVSFAEVDKQSDRLAAALAERGINKGDRVALYCINSTEFVVIYSAIIKAGAVVVPVNLMQNPREVGYVLKDAEITALFYHPLFQDSVDQISTQISSLRFSVVIGEAVEERDESLAVLLECRSNPPEIHFDPVDDLAVILYTSGTTGFPKGAMLTHHNLVADSRSVSQAFKFSEGDAVFLVVLPMFHAFAATVGMLLPMLHGQSFAPLAKFEPALVSDTIEKVGANLFLGVPSMFALFLRFAEKMAPQWRGVNYCIAGGSAMPVAVMQAFESKFGVPILEGDGPTECSPVTCVNPIVGERKAGSVGLPIPGVEMAILNSEGEPLKDDAMGEVCVCGPTIMKGYWRLPEATEESFYGEWFRTGDLGYRDSDGYFYLVDRIKDMIIVNGMNVYPRMIEEVLYQYEKIAEAAVVGEPHDMHGEIPIAYVVSKKGEKLDSTDVRAFCKDNLGKHQVPRRVEIIDLLPRNAAGKVLKRELRRSGEIERGVDSR